VLGTYNPLKNPPVAEIKQERVLDWIKKGAQPTVTVRTILRRAGVLASSPAPRPAAKAR
jgi:small subunit ribosomal protein S16